jgi:hypothetical protein
MIVFLCKPLTEKIIMKKDHTEYKWVDATNKNEHPSWLLPSSENFIKYGLDKFVI